MKSKKNKHEVLSNLRKENQSFYTPLIRYAMNEISKDDLYDSECIEKYKKRLNYLKKRFGDTYIQISKNFDVSHTTIENIITKTSPSDDQPPSLKYNHIDIVYLEIFAFWFQVSPLYLIGKTDDLLEKYKQEKLEKIKSQKSEEICDIDISKIEISEDEEYGYLSGTYTINKRKELISLIDEKQINQALSRDRIRKMKGDELKTPFEYDDSTVLDLAKEIVYNLFPTRIGRNLLIDILTICDASDKHFEEIKKYLISHAFIKKLHDLKKGSLNEKRKIEWDNYELQNPKYRFTKSDCIRIISAMGRIDREFLVLLVSISELPLNNIETIHNWLELCGWFTNKKMFCAKYRIEKVAEDYFLIFFKDDDELTIDIKRRLSN